MDVHRCRFVPYPTSAINTLCFSHSDFSNEHHSNLRLAVGRANGNIELWNPNNNWLQEATFYGGSGRSIEGLEWTKEPDELGPDNTVQSGTLRLFSIGYSSSVTEWSLHTGQPVRHWLGNSSEIWCIAAQPRLKYSDYSKSDSDAWHGQDLVVGCADGTLTVLSTANQNIGFRKFLSRPKTKRGRVLCISFHGRNTVVAGFADSTVRVFDLQKTNLIRTVTLGAGPKGGPKDILVWAARSLPNGDIVTGDSLGEVRVFDSAHKSQIQRLVSHDADVLDIAVNKTGSIIASAGMDRKTAHYQRANNKAPFVKLLRRTYHEHDVKSMATFEGRNMNFIASGGTLISGVLPRLTGNRARHESSDNTPKGGRAVPAQHIRTATISSGVILHRRRRFRQLVGKRGADMEARQGRPQTGSTDTGQRRREHL
jgi:U3 small nucleolar RNA-associated protein 4